MALINLNINSFKQDLGGIANRLVSNAINSLENKLENAIEDVFAKGLQKIGLSDGIVSEISARFGDAFSVGRVDDFFRSSTAEQNRVSQQEIESNFLPVGAAETTLDAIQQINTKDITKAPIMQFPDQLGEYYMVMRFHNYYRPSPMMRAVLQIFKTIILPIPRDLKETMENRVAPSDQKLMGGLADVFVDIGRGAGAAALQGKKFALLYNAITQSAGDFSQLAGQVLGAVPNPHVQAIFSGVNLRTHTFQWTFAPRNVQESKNLKAIIKELKKNSLPAYSTTGTAALQYPPMVLIQLYPWSKSANKVTGESPDSLINFKPCLVSNISINYAPSGLPSFFAGTREPTMIQFEISLMETEIQTAKDYELKAGERPDNLQNLSDLASKGLGNIFGADLVNKAENTVNQLADNYSQGVASVQQPPTPK